MTTLSDGDPQRCSQHCRGSLLFHRACLLAQDFTHEPACQTGERTPQGRFRHQPEQMVHPPFAWQLASFPSLPVCGEEAPYCPLRDFVTLRTTPQKSRHGKPFLPSSLCTRKRSRSWGGNSAGLPGNFLTWPWFPDEHTLWNCGI